MTTLYCPQCGYNLTGLTENRCPECGAGFDPVNLQSRLQQAITPRYAILQLVFIPMGIALVDVLLMVAIARGGSGDGLGVLLAMLIVTGIVVIAHALVIAQAVVDSVVTRRGRINAPWVFRNMVPCFILFTVIEAVLVVSYIVGGCAIILISTGVF